MSAVRASQSEPVQAQNALEVREQHLDLLALTSRRHIGLGPGDATRHISGSLVDRARNLAGRHLRTAPRLKLADIAVVLAGVVVKRRPVIHTKVLVEASTLPAGQR